ncbi:MAG: hypothetical protein MUC50_20775 [Myxococcota bacterium]|jgi:hypothetical protein|nr:hypothetical protein [Myxococcota bacterium]
MMIGNNSKLVWMALLTCGALACACGDTTNSDVTAKNPLTGEIDTFENTESVPDGWVVCKDAECSNVPDECAIEECGPAMGMPTIICADGSIGGNTGRCLMSESGTCGWEVRECPDTTDDTVVDDTDTEQGECEEAKCGPALGMPVWECDDGSLGGNTGRCLEKENGTCGWEIRQCPN